MPRLALLLLALTLVAPVGGQEKYADPELLPADREHWAFKPPVRPKAPAAGNPVDAFVGAKLDAVGLKPSPEADRVTLIRRVTLDLTGLPPTPAEVEAFVNDAAPDAYEKVVDRLLASPHFGERQAQHWLDVVRFAESNGYEADGERPHAWRYRDYVVAAFNSDLPYDRFLTEQLAGDELWKAEASRAKNATGWALFAPFRRPSAGVDALIASGMHRCGPAHMVGGNQDAEVLRQERLTEMVNGVGSAFLGLTVGCARCHDHKFDPFSAGDYYRMQAFFTPTAYLDFEFASPAEQAQRKKDADALGALISPLKAKVAALDSPYRDRIAKAKREKLEPKFRDALDTPADKRTVEQKTLASQANTLLKVTWDEVVAALSPADREARTKLREQIHALEARLPPPTAAAWAVASAGTPAQAFVLKRGDVNRRTLAVGPGFPRVLVTGENAPKNRIEFAKWLTRPDHPLTARVVANRVWQSHFGRGIVATPNDFGLRGDKPTHPELLDWLACELVERKWSLKHLHRLIVTSATYRQSSTTTHGAKLDSDNALLWKMSRRRLEAEAVRDAVLAAAGTLNRQVGGPSVKVPLEPEVYDLIFTEGEPDGLWPVTPDATQHTRRSLYLFNKRNVRLPLLEALDQPDTLNSCAFRPVSTSAPQALILMNGPFVQEQGRTLAVALVKEHADTAKQLEALYRRTVGRPPRAEEVKLAVEFLDAQAETIRGRMKANQPIGLDPKSLPPGTDAARTRALADLCVVMFNTHEFVYRP
ncbi:DUF1549 and DUF1553 domain-containing protein [Gemmata sp.]|uniref:DUF1549 and DUF1553 domain-containing protein n=1 Tax=Gemmata sp. TaxID=1914242 RepID=UPI003F72D6B7